MDLFPVAGHELADLLARCASRTGHDASGSAESDLLTATMPTHQPTAENAASAFLTSRYADLKVFDAFRFLPEGDVYVRCRGGYRPGCGGDLVAFNYPDCPVYLYEASDV
jgi:hypothetical protein